jgi:hypothetical protein
VAAQPIRLSVLLKERHWQSYGAFVREYRKAARQVDPDLEKSPPSRAQFYRWLSGDVKTLPYADHCIVLEKMFSSWTVASLLEPVAKESPPPTSQQLDPEDDGSAYFTRLFSAIDVGFDNPGNASHEWSSTDIVESEKAEANDGQPLSPISSLAAAGLSPATREIGQRLLTLAKARRLTPADTEQLGRLAGNILELDLGIQIDVATDGQAELTYRHELLNMSSRPVTKLARELWFEYTSGKLEIVPISGTGHHVAVQRVHDTTCLAKFACQISPPIRPGEVGVIGYTCRGGQFLEDHYWRQSIPRFTRHFTMRLRHRGGGQLGVCTAVEEHPDGSENSATEDLMWDYEGDDVVIMLTRDYLRPGQAVTLRWAVSNEPT